MMNTDIRHSSKHANRNTFILSLAQSFGGAVGAIAISVGALSGSYLLSEGHQSLATLPVALYSSGAAVFALSVSLLCKKFGRRIGFMIGAIIGIIGAILACYSLLQGLFNLFCLSFLLIGGSGAFVQQYRFAAADQGSDKFKSRAISWVLTGGVLAAIIGPQTVLKTKDLLLPTPFAGAFIGMVSVLVIALIILAFLKPIGNHAQKTSLHTNAIRPTSQILKQPVFITALLCAVSSYALMAFMMTGAPLAIVHHGHSLQDAIVGIQWHILAMYLPSFITGSLIVRFGKIPVITTGLTLLIICALVALSGVALWNFWTSLIFLGIGWNFAFIGSTALLGESYRPEEKNNVQGIHDTILFSLVAIAALLSGATFNIFGWHGIAAVLIPVALLGLASLYWLSLQQQKSRLDI